MSLIIRLGLFLVGLSLHLANGKNALFDFFPSLENTTVGTALHHAWHLGNMLDFCLFPSAQYNIVPFYYGYFRQYGIEVSELEDRIQNKDSFTNEVYERQDEPRIALKTHRVWVSDPLTGKEMFDSVRKNETLFDEILRTNAALDDDTHKWQHYLWTNDISAIPNTTKWFREHGFIVRELRELPKHIYDDVIEEVVTSYLGERFGAAADIARFAILNAEGGFYMDMDFFVNAWDNEMLHYFDSVHFRKEYVMPYEVLNTYATLVSKGHPETREYLDLTRNAHIAPQFKKPIQYQKCFWNTRLITFFETGSFLYSVAHIHAQQKQSKTRDVILDSITDVDGPQTYQYRTSTGEVKEFTLWFYELGLGSWIDVYWDGLQFGFF